MKKSYHTINRQGKANQGKLAEFVSKNGQLLLPRVDLIEQCQLACDELIDMTGRAAIQAVCGCRRVSGGSAAATGKTPSGNVVFYRQQPGMVMLSDRKLPVQ